MSNRVGDIFVISAEAAAACELCGTMAELRPYGPKGERICYECGMKNRETTLRQFTKQAFERIEPTN